MAIKSKIVWTLAWLFAVPVIWAAETNAVAAVGEFAGARVRVAWCQDAGDGSDSGAQGDRLRLMGFDSDDPRGARPILDELSNYSKPLLTPDGRTVIFSNRARREIHAVGFDGGMRRVLAPGVALAVWRDEPTGTDWVYAGTEKSRGDYFNSPITDVRRFRLDKPEIIERVWSGTPVNIDNFQLSADGRRAAGLFPWPVCGIASLPEGGWEKIGDGCWPSLCPDNSLLMWIFDGAHRNLSMVRTGTGERWSVAINTAPGIDNFEVYHPRWSNRPRFMVLTGPYKAGDSSNRIRAGGRDVEIYLGRFAPDFSRIEKWVQITSNNFGDFCPDAWIGAPAAEGAVPTAGTASIQEDPRARNADKSAPGAWPVSFERLVYFWQNRSRANSFPGPEGGALVVCGAEARGRARYGSGFEMQPAGGAFFAEGGSGRLIEQCARNGQFAFEVLLTPPTGLLPAAGRSTGKLGPPEGIAPIAGFPAGDRAWNFLLFQKGARLAMRLRPEKGGDDYTLDIGPLPPGHPSHVIVSCSTSSVVCYLDGEPVFSSDLIRSGNWADPELLGNRPAPLVFGNILLPEYPVEPDRAGGGWRGTIQNVAVYARWIGPIEARRKYAASLAAAAGRSAAELLQVRACLIAEPAIPAPASIAPYRRALLAGHYRVEEIISGACKSKEIMAARWAILDGRIVPESAGQAGKERAMRLELFSDHPELDGERLIMEGDRYDLPLYYETGG